MALSKSAVSAISSYGRVLSQALCERDGFTRRHCDRVIELAGGFGRAFGLDGADLRRLRLCGLFHDIGKIGIPDHVLLKPGRLVDDEWVIMRTHPERGQRIVESIGIDGVADIAQGVRHHHERYDGQGYPDGLAGEDIPFIARMIAIVDGYDAMAASRPYHSGRNHEEIMGIMQGETGGKYDPYLMARFTAMIGESNRKAPAA
ncbi:MAG: HD domain-containing phosphohydrolase [Pseudomonadota bacterium]